jgi:hypothetical protein
MLRTCWLNLVALAFVPLLAAQSDPQAEVAVRGRAMEFFEALERGDTAALRQLIHSQAVFSVVGEGSGPIVRGVGEYLRASVRRPGDTRREDLLSLEVSVDGSMAIVWADYRAFVDGSLAYCGAHALQWVPSGPKGVWQIVSAGVSRRTGSCPEALPEPNYPVADSAEIARLLDDWHAAAARADFDAFFGAIADDGIYLGTDLSERWTKADFARFSKPYFDRGKAWSFRPYERRVYFSADGRTAWFEEKLDTWMGECRGSGVLRKRPGPKRAFEIVHYDLAVAVPNEAIEKYLKILRKIGRKPRLGRG